MKKFLLVVMLIVFSFDFSARETRMVCVGNSTKKGNQFVADYKDRIQIFKDLSSKPEVWIGLVPPGFNVSWGILHTVLKDSANKTINQI